MTSGCALSMFSYEKCVFTFTANGNRKRGGKRQTQVEISQNKKIRR